MGLKFQISLNSFLQVNPYGMELLYTNALKMAGLKRDDVVVDLYCGAGTISLCAAQKCGKVYGVEIVPQAIENAKRNAQLNGIHNAEFLLGDCEEIFPKVRKKEGKIDVIIVDPPRKGLSQQVVSSCIEAQPRKIVYVSCDPATLARDIKLFAQGGYACEGVQPVDMFPQTMHVETVALLSKLKTDKHIDVELEMNELDLTAAEKKATYEEIKEYVLDHSGLKVSNLYIAQVKQKCGIIERENYNKPKPENAKQPKCPPEKEKAIMEALKHFGMI